MASDSGQHITVYGDAFECQSDDCDNDAAVLYRSETDDGMSVIGLCAECWQTWCDAFWQAEMDVNIAVRFGGGDDGEASTCG